MIEPNIKEPTVSLKQMISWSPENVENNTVIT